MFFRIKQPVGEDNFRDYYHFRWKLLRAPWKQPEGSEIDNIEDQCFHLMAINDKNEIIGVARLQFNSTTEAQIRYMAVAKTYERRGIGRELIKTMENHARNSDCKNIILDAREAAVNFYKKMGYDITEKSYLLFDDIQHFRMIKTLKKTF